MVLYSKQYLLWRCHLVFMWVSRYNKRVVHMYDIYVSKFIVYTYNRLATDCKLVMWILAFFSHIQPLFVIIMIMYTSFKCICLLRGLDWLINKHICTYDITNWNNYYIKSILLVKIVKCSNTLGSNGRWCSGERCT